MYRRPIITLSGGGDQVTLDGKGTGFTLMPGSTGIEESARELTWAPVPDGGQVMRHSRKTGLEIFLPVDVHHGYGDDAYALLESSRRRLEQICSGQVEITIRGESSSRAVTAYLIEGLEGDYSRDKVTRTRMTLGLKFLAEAFMWRGPWREQIREIGKAFKPFTSQGVEVGPRNVIANSSFEAGTAEGWRLSKQLDATVLDDPAEGRYALQVVAKDGAGVWTYAGTPKIFAEPGVWLAVHAQVRSAYLFSKPYTRTRVVYYDAADSEVGDEFLTDIVQTTSAYQDLIGASVVPAGTAYARAYIYVYADASGAAPTQGLQLTTDAWIGATGSTQAEALSAVAMYFDGSTPGCGWLGEPYLSPSVRFENPSDFFPVRLSESSVQGIYEVEIEGDGEAWPIWTIMPPGNDALIENLDTGEALFIDGEIDEPITVDTRPRYQDITSPSAMNGELWERAGRIVDGRLVDQDLFPLRPGVNRVRMSMVSATASSSISFRYAETYRAGH